MNPFIESSIGILGRITGVMFKTGSPSMTNDESTFKNIVVGLGVYGDINGQAFLCLDNDFAVALANNMCGAMAQGDELTEISKSALCELGNMIIGNAATLLFNKGFKVDITTPSIIDIKTIMDTFKSAINIPLHCGNSLVNLKILIKEN